MENRGLKSQHDIRTIESILARGSERLPGKPGVYAFWWVGDRTVLLSSNRHIVLKGPRGEPVDVEYRDWWPADLAYPCLYVGKTTSVCKRFGLHLMRGSPGRVHAVLPGNHKATPGTTSCQLRFGIEHLFPGAPEPLELIAKNVGFSYTTQFLENAVAERFFMEDLLIGLWRPWFNIDSER